MKLVLLLALVAATEALKIAAKPSLATAKLDAPSTLVAAGPAEVKALRGGFDMGMLQLLSYFFFWYLGNYYYNISNKLALKAAGGKTGYPMTIAALQMAVGVVYALYMWVAPDSRSLPSITKDDLVKMLPVGFCAMGAHCFSVFAMSAGAVSFGQIVKAAEPAFAAVIGVSLYGKQISKAKWLCLIPVIGGVVLASLKELDFAVSAPGQEKRAKFPTSKAPISAVFHSFRLIFGRAIISRNGLEAWMLFFGTRARGTLMLKRT